MPLEVDIKRFCFYILMGIRMAVPCFAGDYVILYQDEFYKEASRSFSHTSAVYHSLQVLSSAGPKLLILKGENPEYRKWLRQYIAENRVFLAQVPDGENDAFIASRVFEIDVLRIHPMGMVDDPGMSELVRSVTDPDERQLRGRRQIKGEPVLNEDTGDGTDSQTTGPEMIPMLPKRPGYGN